LGTNPKFYSKKTNSSMFKEAISSLLTSRRGNFKTTLFGRRRDVKRLNKTTSF